MSTGVTGVSSNGWLVETSKALYFSSDVRNMLATLVCLISLINARHPTSETCVKILTKFLQEVEINPMVPRSLLKH